MWNLRKCPFYNWIFLILLSNSVHADEVLNLKEGVTLTKTNSVTFSSSVCPCKEKCLEDQDCKGVVISRNGPGDRPFKCAYAVEDAFKKSNASKTWAFLKESSSPPETTTTTSKTTKSTSKRPPLTLPTLKPPTHKPTPKKTTTTEDTTTTKTSTASQTKETSTTSPSETPTTSTTTAPSSTKTTTSTTTTTDFTTADSTTTPISTSTTTFTTSTGTTDNTTDSTTDSTTTETSTQTTTEGIKRGFYHSTSNTPDGTLTTLKTACLPNGVPAVMTNYNYDYDQLRKTKPNLLAERVWLALQRSFSGKIEWYDGTPFTFDSTHIGPQTCYVTSYDGYIQDYECVKTGIYAFCQYNE